MCLNVLRELALRREAGRILRSLEEHCHLSGVFTVFVFHLMNYELSALCLKAAAKIALSADMRKPFLHNFLPSCEKSTCGVYTTPSKAM